MNYWTLKSKIVTYKFLNINIFDVTDASFHAISKVCHCFGNHIWWKIKKENLKSRTKNKQNTWTHLVWKSLFEN